MAIMTPTRLDFDNIEKILKIFQERSNIDVYPDDGMRGQVTKEIDISRRLSGMLVREIVSLVDMLCKVLPQAQTFQPIRHLSMDDTSAKTINNQTLRIYENLFVMLLWNNDVDGRARQAILQGWYEVKLRGTSDIYEVIRMWEIAGASILERRVDAITNVIESMAVLQLVFPQITAFTDAQDPNWRT